LEHQQLLALEAYTLAGYDLMNDIAIPGLNNPMSDNDWMNAGVSIESIYARGGLASHAPYYEFIREMNLKNTYQNYEPNYLSALMKAHPDVLQAAKNKVYEEAIAYYGNDYAGYLEWLKIQKEAIGMLKDT